MRANIEVVEKVVHGIRVCYVRVPSALSTYTGFVTRAGSYVEDPSRAGASHFLEHLFFKGTENRAVFDIVDDAALMGAYQNAYTGEYRVCYFLIVPSLNYAKAVNLLSDMMFNPTLPSEEIEKERTVIQEERKMYEDDPQSFFYAGIEDHVYNYQAGHNIVGTEETISILNREQFAEFRKQMYGTDNTVFLVVGNLDEDEVFGVCEREFSDHPLGISNTGPVDNDLFRTTESKTIERVGIQQTYMAGMFLGDPLKKNRVSYNCMIDAFGGGMYSILFKEIRENLGLCYHVSASKYIRVPEAGSCMMYTQLAPKNQQLAQEKMLECMAKIKAEGFDAKQFECGKQALLGNYCRGLQDLSFIARMIGEYLIWDLEIDFDQRLDALVNLTLDDVNQAAAEQLPEPEDVRWFVMNPAE